MNEKEELEMLRAFASRNAYEFFGFREEWIRTHVLAEDAVPIIEPIIVDVPSETTNYEVSETKLKRKRKEVSE